MILHQVSPTDENIDGFTPVHLAAKVKLTTFNLLTFYTLLSSVGMLTFLTLLPKRVSAWSSQAPKLVGRSHLQNNFLFLNQCLGMTALHIAAYFGEEEITRELFKHIPAYTTTSQVWIRKMQNNKYLYVQRKQLMTILLFSQRVQRTLSLQISVMNLVSWSWSSHVPRPICWWLFLKSGGDPF